MALANCKACGRLFNRLNNDICPVCVKEEEEKFYLVRDYLKENRRAQIIEVSEATGVEVSLIIKFMREGRLSAVDNPNLNYPCDSCGAPISEGRFCKPCKERLNKGFAQTKEELLNAANKQSHGSDYFYKRRR
jgi:flagellar operon protein (TIGR03826 family)